MEEKDFAECDIKHFTKEEIERTGAKLADVKTELIIVLDDFRELAGRVVVLLPNGMTTGQHKAKEHPQGKAVDIGFRETDGAVDMQAMFISALEAGFTGIGIYWNGIAYSMHLDMRESYSFWKGTKNHGDTAWRYLPLVHCP